MSGGTSWAIAKQNEATAQRLYAATKPKNLTPSRTFCNSTTTGLYTGNNMKSGRGEEAEQHKQYTGVGFRAQIERTS